MSHLVLFQFEKTEKLNNSQKLSLAKSVRYCAYISRFLQVLFYSSQNQFQPSSPIRSLMN
jgi:hypothetical protein